MATILIVDDDAALRSAIATALADLGHQPMQAGDGDAALFWLSLHRAGCGAARSTDAGHGRDGGAAAHPALNLTRRRSPC